MTGATGCLCPQSGTKGFAVDRLAVKAMLRGSALGVMGAGQYRFCADPSCGVVYFDDRGQAFTTADLRVSVWQKQPSGCRTVCYCFDENEALMAKELAQTGRCDAVQRIRDHIAADRCACEVRNPRGTCCLGDVIKAVARLPPGRGLVVKT